MVSQMMRSCRKGLLPILLLAVILGVSAQKETAIAQETVQITITGVPGVLPSPFLSDLEDDIVSGRYQVQFTYIPSGADLSMEPVEVVFRARLYHNRELLVDERSLPAVFDPGTHILSPVFDRIDFESTLEDVLSGVRSSLQRQMIQTGALPEGDYRLELSAEVLSGQRVNVIPGQAFFTVSYPPPPQLITPGNRTNVVMSTPVFSWSPVLTRTPVSLEYEFLLVEMFDGQGPEDAIDANRPHHEQTLMDVTSLVYTPDLFPLERGRSYAWMVRAFGAGQDIPIRNDGDSEIFTFTFDDSGVKPEDIANLLEIPLVPGLARLVNLQYLEVDDSGMFYELNGRAEIEFTMDGLSSVDTRTQLNTEPVRLAANVRGLAIQKTGLDNPVVAGGEVAISTSPVNDLLRQQRHFLRLNDMHYRFGEGIRATASLNTQLFGQLQAEGQLSVTTSGFWGTVTAALREGMEFSEGPVTVRIEEVSATFPEAELNASASVEMQGVDQPCTINQFDIQRDILETSFSCRNIRPMPLVGGSTLAELRPNFIFGEVVLSPREDRLEFDITKDARLAISRPDEEELCHVHFQAVYRTGERVGIRPIRQSCDIGDVGLDLGFAEVMLRNLELGYLELNPSDGQWDFSLSFDSRLKVELFGGWESPWMENTTISNNGMSFEQFEFVRNSPTLPDFDISDLVINLQRFAIEEFTFPVFDWEESGPGPWEVSFDGDVQLPPGAGFPSCLTGIGLKFENGTIADDRAVMPFSLNLTEPCRWEFGAGYAVSVAGLSGMAGAEWEPLGDGQQIRPFADLSMQGGFSAGYPFRCGDAGSESQEQVQVSFSGGFQADLQNVHPDCPMQIGPFTGQVNESSLSLSWSRADGQQGELGGDITLQFSDNVQADGSFLIDIIEGRFVDGDIIIQGPFDWSIPSDEYGVLTFRINQASISADGLFIDGRQSLRLGDDPIGVTFDELLLDLHDLSIRSGQIIFDETFALEAGIDTDRSLQFAALPPDSNTTLDPGLYMELGSTVIIDSTGIATMGEGRAALYYGDKSFDSDVTVAYTDDFRMSLYPFGVAGGRADIYWNDSKVAYIDRNGLNPVFAFFADLLIPDILPLPSESVAYLRLRDDEGELLVEGTETPDGDYALSTLPGASLTLVVPAWDPANPPEVAGAQLHDLVLSGDPSTPVIVGGGVTVDISSDDALYDLTGRNIPLRLTRIHYGETIPDEQMMTMSALYLEGNLHLFDNELEEAGSVGFLLGDGGLVLANLDLSDMNQPVPMVPGSNRVVYTLNELQGSFQGSLDGSVPASFGFDIGGFFEINDDQQTVASTALDVHLTQSTFEVTAYDGEMADLPRFNLGFFGLEVTEIVSFPHLSWSSEDGFSFEVAVDLSLHFNLSEGTSFGFPLAGVEIRDSGVVIPEQDVSISSAPGLTLPSFELLGMQFRPLALRTMAALDVDWYQNEFSFDLDPRIDFELHLPAFADTDLHPPDGLTFTDVGFEEGHLVGTVQTHIPLGGAMVPLGPPTMNPPVILVDSLGGTLTREVTAEGPQQTVSLYAYSRLENVPAFSRPDDDDPCPQNPDVTLQIIDGSGFAGSVEGFQSCGEVDLGPVALGIEDASLHFSFADGEQSLRASGTIGATLPAPGDTEISVSGSGEIDLFTGMITDGSISITDEFLLAYGPAVNPLFEFTVQQALLDASGLQISGQGSFGSDDISVGVAFNDLLFELPSFTVASGNAVISPGFSLQVGTDLSSISVTFGDDPLEMENVFRYTMDEEIVITSDGISFTGAGTASLFYQGESFLDIGLQFHDNFTVEVRQYRVAATLGRAEFYLTDPSSEYYEEGEPFIIWDPVWVEYCRWAAGVAARPHRASE
jgi:large repetitive protein